MKHGVKKACFTALVAFAVFLSFASGATGRQDSVSSAAAAPAIETVAVKQGAFWSPVRDYFVCIVGLGLPVTTALTVAFLPAYAPAITTYLARDSAMGGRSITRTTDLILRACGRFIRS